MVTKYNIDIDGSAIQGSLKRITNQVYKLLPMREEGGEWEKLLDTLFVELSGMDALLGRHEKFFSLLCKLEGMRVLADASEFALYRRTIFECLTLLNAISEDVKS